MESIKSSHYRISTTVIEGPLPSSHFESSNGAYDMYTHHHSINRNPSNMIIFSFLLFFTTYLLVPFLLLGVHRSKLISTLAIVTDTMTPYSPKFYFQMIPAQSQLLKHLAVWSEFSSKCFASFFYHCLCLLLIPHVLDCQCHLSTATDLCTWNCRWL